LSVDRFDCPNVRRAARGPVKRLHQTILISSTIVASWLGMQVVHECGHVLGAWCTGGEVGRVVLHPLTISRTDLATNPHPLLVVWAGPTFGVLCPLALWGAARASQIPGSFALRFFAGFCLIANGAYIAFGSIDRIGDCGEMLRHGSQIWQLWLFGALSIPTGFWLWHRQGTHFGFGSFHGVVYSRVGYSILGLSLLLIALELAFGSK
jgi:hypothetical protein